MYIILYMLVYERVQPQNTLLVFKIAGPPFGSVGQPNESRQKYIGTTMLRNTHTHLGVSRVVPLWCLIPTGADDGKIIMITRDPLFVGIFIFFRCVLVICADSYPHLCLVEKHLPVHASLYPLVALALLMLNSG